MDRGVLLRFQFPIFIFITGFRRKEQREALGFFDGCGQNARRAAKPASACAVRGPSKKHPHAPSCFSAWERRDMIYEVFRNAVTGVLKEEEKNWDVIYDWGDPPVDLITGEPMDFEGEMEMTEDMIELEREKGLFYEFISFSVKELYHYYQEEGWDAVVLELERHIRQSGSARRNRGINYAERLDDEGKELYEKLRSRRALLAAQKQLPAYIVFTNRSLYEMCCARPVTMEELRAIYGVGEKNSKDYGEAFLEVIREFVGAEEFADRINGQQNLLEM